MRAWSISFLQFPDLFDGPLEYPRDLERERQTRIEPACFNSVDRLSRHADTVAELLLRPVDFGAQHAQTVLHRAPRTRKNSAELPMPASQSRNPIGRLMVMTSAVRRASAINCAAIEKRIARAKATAVPTTSVRRLYSSAMLRPQATYANQGSMLTIVSAMPSQRVALDAAGLKISRSE